MKELITKVFVRIHRVCQEIQIFVFLSKIHILSSNILPLVFISGGSAKGGLPLEHWRLVQLPS